MFSSSTHEGKIFTCRSPILWEFIKNIDLPCADCFNNARLKSTIKCQWHMTVSVYSLPIWNQ